ncbi:MAG: SH3 domain-containing protein [Ruminococcus sp.]|nr:SH3 domain-containing protein [Ruminococcus sp.]
MANFNEKDARPAEKLTIAGIAAIIVVGVFVVCVILILAKSLFPSNDNSVPDGEYTGTKPAENVTTTLPKEAVTDTADSEVVIDLNESSAEEQTESEAETAESDESVADGETAILNQTAYLRSTGDMEGEPIFSIDAGEEVTVLERPAGSEYVKVSYYGTEGWIYYEYLT